MNEAKTIQALQEIFRLRGPEILTNRRQFQAYLEDILGGGAYATERRVFQLAMDSNALWPLAKTASISSASAGTIVEQLQRENRMLHEDAEFVVRCVAAARGSSVDFSAGQEEARRRQEEEAKKRDEERRRQEEEARRRQEEEARRRQEEEAKKRDEEHRRQEEEAKRRDEERRRQEEEAKKREEERRRQEEVEISCKINRAKGLFKKRGVLCLYPDSLCFEPNRGEDTDISYDEIEKISAYFVVKWMLTLFVLAVFAAIIFWGYLDGWYEASAALVSLGIVEIPMLILMFRGCSRRLLITTKPAEGEGPGRYMLTFYSPADKKQAVRYLRSHMAK